VSKNAEQWLANGLLTGMLIGWVAIIIVTIRQKRKSILAAPAVAAVIGYVCYVAAALFADAKFPEFMREHLFDGLAPAAAVGLLVNIFPAEHPEKALPWIRRRVMILVLFYAGGALIFSAIALAAVFVSGSQDYFGKPVAYCAIWGGYLFGFLFFAQVNRAAPQESWSEFLLWWLTKPRERAAMPEPSGPEESATPAAADAAQGGSAPAPG
jgi:hypothetical protein